VEKPGPKDEEHVYMDGRFRVIGLGKGLADALVRKLEAGLGRVPEGYVEPITVPCPFCGAPAGEPCRTKAGRVRNYHAKRAR